jgi:16S rRNA (guanine(966)-N(2))-methyltransferase RsmD
MRVIAGAARGVPLISPEGRDLRPTLDRVRENLFNILQPWFPGPKFLDLFSGTGANGIEALSRGAAAAVFVDSDRAAQSLTRGNLEKTRLASNATCLQLALPDELHRIPGTFNIIFADPPYAFEGVTELPASIADQGLLDDEGILIIEHSRKITLPETAAHLSQFRYKKYGDTGLTFYT